MPGKTGRITGSVLKTFLKEKIISTNHGHTSKKTSTKIKKNTNYTSAESLKNLQEILTTLTA